MINIYNLLVDITDKQLNLIDDLLIDEWLTDKQIVKLTKYQILANEGIYWVNKYNQKKEN